MGGIIVMRQIIYVVLVASPAAYGAVDVRTDHSDAMYRCGEAATFTVHVTDEAGQPLSTGKVSAVVDDFGSHRQFVRDIDLSAGNPFKIHGLLQEPGFLRLTLSGAGVEKPFVWSVGYEPERIRPVTRRAMGTDPMDGKC